MRSAIIVLRHFSHNMSFFTNAATSAAHDIVLALLYSSSESDDVKVSCGGSRPGRAANVERHRGELGDILYRHYLSADPTHDHTTFRRRFRVSRDIFDRLFDAVIEQDTCFTQRSDCTGKKGLSPFQKITAAIRMLAYGVCADRTFCG